MGIRRWTLLILVAVLPVAGKATAEERIRAFCIDFNWGEGGPNGFAPPGMYSHATPADHIKWYRELGVNTVQTFCVNCCGYAWFRSDVAPVQPGMKGDFLKEMVQLGHAEGMRVMGYFCVGANTWWGRQRPELSYGTPSHPHIPLTTAYLDYLTASITDAIKKTGIDGFMIDWVFNLSYHDGAEIKWLECEQQMYAELFDEPFPGKERITPERETEFHRRAVDRCWRRIRKATKAADPDCIIWLSSHKLSHPQTANSRMLREVDWLMNEDPDPGRLAAVRKVAGPHTRIIQCVCGWGDRHDPSKVFDDPRYADVGIYGFAWPDSRTTFPATTESKNPRFAANARNIQMIRKGYHDLIAREGVASQPAASRKPGYIQNVDYLDLAWWGKTEDGAFYRRPQIARLLDTARAHGFTRVLWRTSAFGKQVYPSKVREMYAGDSRPESKRAAETIRSFDPLQTGVEECRKRGMKVYAWMTIYDDGGSLDNVEGVTSRFSIEHPEYLWCTRDGSERYPGVLCYAYPEVRKHRLDEIRELLGYNVDGIFLSTRSHSRPGDPDEKYGFNEPIVRAYRDRHGIDIRTEDFDKRKWRDLRGEFLTQFVKEAHELCAGQGRALVMGIRTGETLGWPLGKMTQDWRTWIRKGYVNGVCTYALNDILFDKPDVVRSRVNEMIEVAEAKIEIWTWVRLWDWSSRFPNRSSVPADVIFEKMRTLHGIPGLDACAFHEALILENHDLWSGLAR